VLKGGKIEVTKLDSNETLLTINLNTPLKKKEVIRYINVLYKKTFSWQQMFDDKISPVNALFVQFDY